jgi:hypothetical protein
MWPRGFRGKDFLEIDHSEARIACGGHVCKCPGLNEHSLKSTFRKGFIPSVGSFGQAV